jgi:hypothetical protein
MSPTELKEVRKPMPARITRLGYVLLGAGLALAAVAYMADGVRSSFNNIVLFMFMASLAGGAVFLIALEYLAGAVWSVPMRRVNEILAAMVFVAPLLAIPLFFNLHDLFHWTHLEQVQADAVLSGKRPYLNVEFFAIRFGAVFLLWWVFAFAFRRNSVKQDASRDPKLTTINIRLGALFMPVFAITVTVLAVDWAMSLEPHWFSTIFGVYYFSGTVLAALAAGTYIILRLHEAGRLPGLRRDHFYSLGALQFAFVNFWAYIAFSQFLLIWYADLPEETYWFIHRWANGWEYYSILLIVVHFAVPYFALLSQDSKMDPRRLKFISLWIVAAHFMDLYWLVMPTHSKDFTIGWIELAFPLTALGLLIVVVSFVLKRTNLVPIGDPKLQRGLDFRL